MDTLSEQAGQPPGPQGGWFKNIRRQAGRVLKKLDPPERTEDAWRFTDLEQFRLERYQGDVHAAGPLPSAAQRGDARALDSGIMPAGYALALDGRQAELALGQQAKKAGVLLTSLSQAAITYPELVRQGLGSLLPARDYYAAASLAEHRDGLFLFVPEGVELSEPILGINWLASDGGLVSTRNLIIVERGASLVLDELYLSAPLSRPTLGFPVTELVVGEGARVRHAAWQHLAAQGRHMSRTLARVDRDARLDSLVVTTGGHTSRTWTEVSLAGPGAESRMLGVNMLGGDQRAEHWTVQDHLAHHTTSDLLYHSVVGGRARSVYNGSIRVAPGARGTNAFQENRNLLLSDAARALTIPQLEIQEDDVRCSHGATVGPLDLEQLFYMTARGIPPAEAERLLVLGFLGTVLEEASWAGLRQRLEASIRDRLDAEDKTEKENE